MVVSALVLRGQRLDTGGAGRVVGRQGAGQSSEIAGEFDTIAGCSGGAVRGFPGTAGQFLDVLRLPRFGGGKASIVNFHIGYQLWLTDISARVVGICREAIGKS